MHAGPREVKVAFLQGLFESKAVVNVESKTVMVPVQASYLNNLMRILKDVGTSPHVIGMEPLMVAVDIREAARIPLFNPEIRSKKYQETASFASMQLA